MQEGGCDSSSDHTDIARTILDNPSQRTCSLIHKLVPEGKPLCAYEVCPHLAASHGHLELIKHLHARGIYLQSEGADCAASSGHMEIVRYLYSEGITCTSHGADVVVMYWYLDKLRELDQPGVHCTTQGANKYLDNLRELNQMGVCCTSKAADWAACAGDLKVLKYLKSHGKATPTEHGMFGAAFRGHFHIVEYAFNVWNIQAPNDCVDVVVSHGHLDALIHLCDNQGLPLESYHTVIAAEHGHVHIIRFLRARGVSIFEHAANNAAIYDSNLAVIQDLREHGIHCTYYGANVAAQSGALMIIRDLHAHNIRCTTRGANHAARNNHFHVVRELRQYGIFCTTEGADSAAARGYLEMVKELAVADGVYCSERGARWAHNGGYDDVVEYLQTLGIRTPRTSR